MNVVAMYAEQPEEDPILVIFTHWQTLHGHARSRLDLKRRKSIQARLDDGYTMEDIKDAISGCFLSAFHTGDNDRGTCYNDLSLICRDAEHIDRFIGLYEDGQAALSKSRIAPKEDQKSADPETARRHLEAMKRLLKGR